MTHSDASYYDLAMCLAWDVDLCAQRGYSQKTLYRHVTEATARGFWVLKHRITPNYAVMLLDAAGLIPRDGNERVPATPEYKAMAGYHFEGDLGAGLYGDPLRAAQILRVPNMLRFLRRSPLYSCGFWDGWEGLPPEGGVSRRYFRPPPGFLEALRTGKPNGAVTRYLRGYADGQNGHAACWLAWRNP